jgi:phosphoserine phosphatase RsbU/P
MDENIAPLILVIDDEDIVRESLVAYLEDSNYDVIEANNGKLGLHLFETRQPDLVLCDLRMPKMDGLSVLKTITESDSDVPVIVVSGAGVMSDVVEALRLGASDYLVKPVADLSVLEHSVEQNLQRIQLLRENRNYRKKLEESNNALAETVQLLESDLQAGRQIQAKLLPKTALQVKNFTFEHYIQPSLFLSGDFVDYFEVMPGVVFVCLADVAGHGVSSALVTVLIKNELSRLRSDFRHQVSETILHPERVLGHLNEELCHSEIGKHATVFLALINTNLNVMSWSSAGHYPAPLVNVDNEWQWLESNGLAVGIMPDNIYTGIQTQWQQEFWLYACTDGLFELWADATLSEKEKKWKELVESKQVNPQSLASTLKLDGLVDIPDDITFLSVNYSHERR